MTTLESSRRSLWCALALSGLSFAVYVLTLSVGVYPGRSASLVAECLGVAPRLMPPRPVWGALAWLVAGLPVGTAATRLNLLSAVCGSLTVGLLYLLVRGVVLASIEQTKANKRRSVLVSEAAGVGAALALAFSVPFWVVSTRAHTASLHILLLTVCGWLLHRHVVTRRWRTALVFALLYGVGVVEFATFIVLAPLAGCYLIVCLWRREELRVSAVLQLMGWGAIGLLLYPLVAWVFHGSEAFQLREYRGYWHVLWIMWRDQYYLIAHSLPQRGWLLVVVLTAVPWLAVLITARRALNAERDWGYYLLHLVVTGLTFAMLFNIKLAPWPMLGMDRFLVTPYLLMAMVFGYLVAYWSLIPFQVWLERDEAPTSWRPVLSVVLGLACLGAAGAAAVLNLKQADGRPAAVVNRYAREIVDCLDGREWLVTDGSLDAHIRVAAHERGVPVKVLSLAWDRVGVMKNYARTLFDTPALKNRARLGMIPLLQEWARSDDRFKETVALFGPADTWATCGLDPIPNGLVFLAGGPGPVDPERPWARHQALWEDARWLTDVRGPMPVTLLPHIRRQAAMVANNLGVLMEDLGDDDRAGQAYRTSRELDAFNVSALLNLKAMADRGALTDESGELQSSIDELADKLGERRLQIWALSRHYGYVRMPEAFVGLGWYWAASGRPRMAASGLRKALDLLPEARQGDVKQALADVYLAQDQDADSEALYRELLASDPENSGALLGLAHIELLRGNVGKASDFLTRAETSGVSAAEMDLEWCALETQSKQTDKATARLERVVSENPKLLRAWAMLTGIYIEQGNEPELASAVATLEGLHMEPNIVIAVAQAFLAAMRNDLVGTRQAFDQAVSLSPQNLRVLEWILRLDLIQGSKGDARGHMDAILCIDPDHAFANRILGTLQYAEGELELAEDSLRRSVAKAPTPGALNDLAWLLQESGVYEEAEALVRSSLVMNDSGYQAWDTLGVILMRTGRLEAATRALERARTVAGERTSVLLHTAELLILQDEMDLAREALDSLAMRRDQMSPTDQEQLQVLRAKLRL